MTQTQFTLPEQSDWCDNMTLRSYNYAPVLPVKVSRPYFSTRPQGAREKFGVWGRDYSSQDTAMLTTQTNHKNAGVVSLRASGVAKILQTAVRAVCTWGECDWT